MQWSNVFNFLRLIVVCGVGLAMLVAAFIALQGLALQLTDDRRIIGHLQESVARNLLTDDNYPQSPYGHNNHRFDMYSECVALSINLGNDDAPLLYRLAATPLLGFRYPNDPCRSLVEALRTGKPRADNAYFQYWHGHQVYLRPLLSVVTIEKVRHVNAILLIGVLSLLVLALVRAFGPAAAPAFVLPLLIGTDVLTIPTVTVHALSLIWNCVCVVIVARLIERRGATDATTLVSAFCLGTIGSFFDFLYTPVLAPTLIGFLAMWHSLDRSSVSRASMRAGCLVAFLFAGVVLGWAAKWIFSACVLGFDAVAPHVLAKTRFWTGGEIPVRVGGEDAPFAAIYSVLNEVGFGLIAICAILAALILARDMLIHFDPAKLKIFAALQLPLLIPLLWAELVRHHTMIHFGFVSRAYVLFAVLPLLAAIGLSRSPHPGHLGRTLTLRDLSARSGEASN